MGVVVKPSTQARPALFVVVGFGCMNDVSTVQSQTACKRQTSQSCCRRRDLLYLLLKGRLFKIRPNLQKSRQLNKYIYIET